ncbi:hypothetical protein BV20DRAFT_872916 [Pilatotrama ljubarskyi]|nr:hypothetical protein BV20DRAFT_872916 [Pilatotrama ljubarskyi]
MASDAGTESKSHNSGSPSIDGGAVPSFQQDPDLWFEDGSIVVVAQNTGYRVHTSLLSRLSPIFRDMIAIPVPRNEHTVQGAPIVYVPDSAHDMGCLLRAVYEPRRHLNDNEADIPFARIAALMRLGHKYEMPDIVNEAARHLEEHFIINFNTWMDYCDDERSSGLELSEDRAADYVEAVNLARLTGKLASLPLALYSCCHLRIPELLHGVERGCGDIVRLSSEDTERCIRGREGLLRASSAFLDVIRSTSRQGPRQSCESEEKCAEELDKLMESASQMAGSYLTTEFLSGSKPLQSIKWDRAWHGICYDCRSSLASSYRVYQRMAWDDLLIILNLSADDLGISWPGPNPLWGMEMD